MSITEINKDTYLTDGENWFFLNNKDSEKPSVDRVEDPDQHPALMEEIYQTEIFNYVEQMGDEVQNLRAPYYREYTCRDFYGPQELDDTCENAVVIINYRYLFSLSELEKTKVKDVFKNAAAYNAYLDEKYPEKNPDSPDYHRKGSRSDYNENCVSLGMLRRIYRAAADVGEYRKEQFYKDHVTQTVFERTAVAAARLVQEAETKLGLRPLSKYERSHRW